MTTYAVESYDSSTNSYSRHEVGSKQEMLDLASSLVADDVNNDRRDRYYRVNSVTDKDLEDWNWQVRELPDVPNTDKIFGEWIQIGVASKYLDVTFGRVFNLVTSGQIEASTVGRNKLVSVHDVADRKINPPKAGRPYPHKDSQPRTETDSEE